MSQLTTPTPALLFSSILYNSKNIAESELVSLWEEEFGKSLSYFHSYCPMKRFYSPEMGPESDLKRFFLLRIKFVERNLLVPAKKWAIQAEEKFQHEGKRKANIDVGLIALENVQLATGKNFTHRVYLADNIYSDLTLIMGKEGYRALEWSYPDYSHPEIIEWFNWSRRLIETT